MVLAEGEFTRSGARSRIHTLFRACQPFPRKQLRPPTSSLNLRKQKSAICIVQNDINGTFSLLLSIHNESTL